MSNHADLKALNNEVDTCLKNKDFKNAKIATNLKKAKVLHLLHRWLSIVNLILNMNQSNIFHKLVYSLPIFSEIF